MINLIWIISAFIVSIWAALGKFLAYMEKDENALLIRNKDQKLEMLRNGNVIGCQREILGDLEENDRSALSRLGVEFTPSQRLRLTEIQDLISGQEPIVYEFIAPPHLCLSCICPIAPEPYCTRCFERLEREGFFEE